MFRAKDNDIVTAVPKRKIFQQIWISKLLGIRPC